VKVGGSYARFDIFGTHVTEEETGRCRLTKRFAAAVSDYFRDVNTIAGKDIDYSSLLRRV